MRNKKASMELSINSIVILVIAIVMMGLILGFIRTKFSEVGGNLVANEPEPQAADNDDKMTLSREMISTIPGGQAILKINIFNPTAFDITGAKPDVICSGLSKPVTIQTPTAKTIASGTTMSYIITISVAKTEGRGKSALCTINVAGAAKAEPWCRASASTMECNPVSCSTGICVCSVKSGSGTCTPECAIGTLNTTNKYCEGISPNTLIPSKDFAIQVN